MGKFFKIDFSNGKYVVTFESSMLEALENAVPLNDSNPIRCYEITLEEYRGITEH